MTLKVTNLCVLRLTLRDTCFKYEQGLDTVQQPTGHTPKSPVGYSLRE